MTRKTKIRFMKNGRVVHYNILKREKNINNTKRTLQTRSLETPRVYYIQYIDVRFAAGINGVSMSNEHHNMI